MSFRSLAAVGFALCASLSMAQSRFADDPPADRGGRIGSSPQRSTGASEDRNLVRNCVIGFVNKIDVPAPEAGILTYLGVEQGSVVKREEVLAEIDARQAEQALRIAEFAYASAKAVADDEIEIEYADISATVERADVDELLQANKMTPGAIPAAELRKERLEYDRARLGAIKARKDQQLAVNEASVKLAELEAAQLAVERRRILADFDGEVLNVERRQGEWVQPGQTIVEIAQLDTLQVDGYVYYDQYQPDELVDSRVTVTVRVGNRTDDYPGFIVYIDPAATYDSRPKYLVRAEIANRRRNGRWEVSPNLPVSMRVQPGAKAPAEVGRGSRRATR